MKRLLILFMFSALLVACQQAKEDTVLQPELIKLWESTEGFSVPESVLFDEERSVIYVSNIEGMPSDIDSTGYISRLDTNGNMINQYWIQGLSAPKGMAISGNTLYVSDIDALVAIDIDKASIIKRWHGMDARFLNDVTCSPDGRVYVSDMRTASIYTLQDDSLHLFMHDTLMLNHVNGLNYRRDTLFAGTYPRILGINTGVKEITIIADSTGSIDGLEALGQDWIFSDWQGHVTMRMNDSDYVVLNTTPEKINAADIDFIESKMLLFVPTFFHHSVAAYQLKINEISK